MNMNKICIKKDDILWLCDRSDKEIADAIRATRSLVLDNQVINVDRIILEFVKKIQSYNKKKAAYVKPDTTFSQSFYDQFDELLECKKWRNKPASAIKKSLDKLHDYTEFEATELVARAIAGDYMGIPWNIKKTEKTEKPKNPRSVFEKNFKIK